MKKCNLITSLLTLLAFMPLAEASNHHIYEIRPLDPTSLKVEKDGAWTTSDSPLESGDQIAFVIRLLNDGYQKVAPSEEGNPWFKQAITPGSEELVDYTLSPLYIGIVVGGRTQWAKVENVVQNSTKLYYTDVKCTYTVKAGDLAMPIRLAVDTKGTPMGLSDTDEKPVFLNWSDGVVEGWRITNKDGVEPDFLMCPEESISSNYAQPEGYERFGGNGDLKECGFYVKTIDFTDRDDKSTWYEADGSVWRGIPQGSIGVGKPSAPTVSAVGTVTEATTLYVWSDNPNVVVLTEGEDVTMNTPDKTIITTKVWSLKVLAGQTVPYKIPVKGVVEGDTTANLILSQYKGFQCKNTGNVWDDYLKVPVKCIHELQASVDVTVSPEQYIVVAEDMNGTAYTKPIATIEVNISAGYTGDQLTLNLTPSIPQNKDPDLDWSKYVRISDSSGNTAWETTDPFVKTYTQPELEQGITETLYVYALGADYYTRLGERCVKFIPTITEAAADAHFVKNAGALWLQPDKPTGIPAISTATSYTAIATKDRSFEISIKDNYKNLTDDEGYQIWYRLDDGDEFKQLEGTYKPDDEGILRNVEGNALPSLKYGVAKTYTTSFYVKTPKPDKTKDANRISSEEITTYITVLAAPTVEGQVQLASGDWGKTRAFTEYIEDSESVDNGQVTIRVKLSRALDVADCNGADGLYAFLIPVAGSGTEGRCEGYPIFDANNTGANGMPINIGDTESAEGEIFLTDGSDTKTGNLLKFKVALCTDSSYDATKVVSSFTSSTFQLYVKNVKPTIQQVMMGAYSVEESGSVIGTVPKGVAKTFKFNVSDADPDLNAEGDDQFQLKYSIIDGVYSADGTLEGNPNSAELEYTFKSPGEATVKLWVKDKDTSKFATKADFEFKVNVSASPYITIVNRDNPDVSINGTVYNETQVGENSPALRIKLSETSVEDLSVKLTIENMSGNGKMEFSGLTKVSDTVYTGTIRSIDGVVAFKYSILDGTQDTADKGFKLTAEVTSTGVVPGTKDMKWADYYITDPVLVTITNVEPTLQALGSYEPGNAETNGYASAIGPGPVIGYRVSDVNPDVTGKLTVEWAIAGDVKQTDQITDSTKHTYQPEFTVSGDNVVSATVTDKDGGSNTYTWHFDVAAAKQLVVIAHGPSAGDTKKTLANRYNKAKGLGEGRVTVVDDGSFQKAVTWWQTWNMGLATEARVASAGYKWTKNAEGEWVADVDNGTLFGTDTAIDKDGNAKKGGTITDYYTYEVADYISSYHYAWVITEAGEGESGQTTITRSISPETSTKNLMVDSTVALPTALKEGASSYPVSYAEAIFSREYRVTDNCGDINQDGIPDVFAVNYNLGYEIVDDGTITGDDLTDVSNLNDDEDFLPADPLAGYKVALGASNTWVNTGVAFTAIKEVRGMHVGLNARDLLGITSDRDYSNLEMVAWKKNGCPENWSPENPSDPTMEDTDHDNLPDGYEYYYWYLAHVGYWSDGNDDSTHSDSDFAGHKFLTGHRYNVHHPDEWDILSSKEIELAFNPTEANSESNINKRDTDNDGIPDYLEFVLGTNPVECDTDGDGLPDYWEVTYTELDPCKAMTDDQTKDGNTNPDGDFMASCTSTDLFCIYGFVAENGRPYYRAIANNDDIPATQDIEEVDTARLLTVGGKRYVLTDTETDLADLVAEYIEEGAEPKYFLKKTLTYNQLFELDDNDYRRGGAELTAGTQLDAPIEEDFAAYKLQVLANDTAARTVYDAWKYGYDQDFVLGNEQPLFKDGNPSDPLLTSFASYSTVKLLHWQVYQWRGFERDPRYDIGTGFNPLTAWYVNKNGRVADRWNPVNMVSQPHLPVYAAYVGTAEDTAGYSTLDEYLLMNFTEHATGAYENSDIEPNHYEAKKSFATIFGNNTTAPANLKDENGEITLYGADSDKDGVPDGWELYVMCGPGNDNGTFNTANAAPTSLLGPKNAKANQPATTALATDPITKNNISSLTELANFNGTDSCAAYADVETIGNGTPNWINKFWPTDPWSTDTDGDGVSDVQESKYGLYSNSSVSNAVGGVLWCYAGGGMNPCSVDTDFDWLPDPWEAQYSGGWFDVAKVRAGEQVPTRCQLNAFSDYAAYFGEENIFCGGMNPTQYDAFTEEPGDLESFCLNRDYDHDGLDNWQEYLSGFLRMFRYDDTTSPWDVVTKEQFAAMTTAEQDELKSLWIYGTNSTTQTTFDSPLNPVMYGADGEYGSGTNPRGSYGAFDSTMAYATTCRNTFDPCYLQTYFYPDGPYHALRRALPNAKASNSYYGRILAKIPLHGEDLYQTADYAPTAYFGCDPCDYDSDGDGMDDYYELYHGMNPLYGGTAGLDLIANQWGYISATHNFWTYYFTENPDELPENQCARGNSEQSKLYDFRVFPWMSGDPEADPDGDSIRNVVESIQANAQANKTWLHTDPTPLWYTDTHDPMSFVSRYYQVSLNPWGILTPYNFAFEENEGYDSDHDGVSDFRETQTGADPQNADSTLRRQALYFTGDKSAAQVPVDAYMDYLNEELYFTEFTVEFWAKAENPQQGVKQVIIERLINLGASNPGDVETLRRNFQLGITEEGFWYAAYDPSGSGDPAKEEIVAKSQLQATANQWTHIAATYDGTELVIYINGDRNGYHTSSAAPATHVGTVNSGLGDIVWSFEDFRPTINGVQFDTFLASYARTRSFTLGAAVKSTEVMNLFDDANAGWVNTATQIPNYSNFYKGWVDEVRVWDGARSATQISQNFEKRFTKDDIAENRQQVYTALIENGCKRDINQSRAEGTLPPELAYHYSFDGLLGASDASSLATSPYGFSTVSTTIDAKAPQSRPDNWVSPQWDELKVTSRTYSDHAYIPWIPNTVAHLPRLDGTTCDSMYWAESWAGRIFEHEADYNYYAFPQVCELYTQVHPVVVSGRRDTRLYLALMHDKNYSSNIYDRYTFVERVQSLNDTDLLPLGNTFVKYTSDMWDNQGASSNWEVTGTDDNFNNIADWWEALIVNNSAYTDKDGNKLTSLNDMTWNDEIIYNNVVMTLGSAYLRDLAYGAHQADSGAVLTDDTRRQTSDTNRNDIPDWWENLFSLTASTGFSDNDGDGLSDYAEYVISEVFKLSPVNPNTAFTLGNRPDYYQRLGQLYYGEIFTDHDLVADDWESKYLASSETVSPYVFDPEKDGDDDGWSNRSEYLAGTDPTCAYSVGIETTQFNEYPVPTIEAKISYYGKQNIACPITVLAWTDDNLESIPDARWTIGDVGTSSDSSSSSSNVVAKTKIIGRNPARSMLLHLSPGNLVPGTVQFEFKDPEWTLIDTTTYQTYYSTESYWFANVHDRQHSEDLNTGDLVCQSTDALVGSVNYRTGEVNIDFTQLPETFWISGNAADPDSSDSNYISLYTMSNCYVRAGWSSMTSASGVGTYYLSDADPRDSDNNANDHVKEGLNTFVVFADTLEVDGKYTPGEPYGFVRNVDVGWDYAKFEVVLTDTHPVFARVNCSGETGSLSIVGDSGVDTEFVLNDRDVLYGLESGNYDRSKITAGHTSGGKTERVRVVRTLFNGAETSPVVVLDKLVDVENYPYITEADFLRDGNLDIDWEGLSSSLQGADVTNVTYRIVLGNGDVSNATTNNLLQIAISRAFDSSVVYSKYAKPVTLKTGVVTTTSPTFSWAIPYDLNSYTAFRVQIADSKQNLIWDSGDQLMPGAVYDTSLQSVTNTSWRYDWKAPVWVGAKMVSGDTSKVKSGNILANNTAYYWRVAIKNARYRDNRFSAWQEFRMQVPEGSADYGSLPVAVRYYGPAISYSNGTIRVQAFSTPDFTGRPVGETFVSDYSTLTNEDTVANATIAGVLQGSYYVRAFFDANDNGECELAETHGAYCERDHKTSSLYLPITFSTESISQAVVYLDDSDTDKDNLPDAWEIGTYATYDKLGPVSLDKILAVTDTVGTISREYSIKSSLVTELKALGALGVMMSTRLSSAGVAALMVGDEPYEVNLVDDSVEICDVEFKNGKVVLLVSAEADSTSSAGVFYEVPTTVTVDVYVAYTDSLAADFTEVKATTITVGSDTCELVELNLNDLGLSNSGFFKIRLEKVND